MSIRGSRGRQATVSLAVVLGAVVALAGCGASNKTSEKPKDSDATQVLNFAVYGAPAVISTYTKIAAAYTAQNPKTIVQVQPYDTEQAAVTANAEKRAAKSGPDIFLMDAAQLPEMMREKAIQPVDRALEDHNVNFGDGYQRDGLEVFSRDTALQCMPADVSPMVVYYNRALINLDRATPSGASQNGASQSGSSQNGASQNGATPVSAAKGWTMAQFKSALQQVVRPNNKAVAIAPTLEQIAPFVWSGGGSLVDDSSDPKRLNLTDGASATGLEQLLEIVRDPNLTFSEAALQRRSALQRFENGHLGAILGYRDLTPRLRAHTSLDFDVMPIPKVGKTATVAKFTGLCMSATTPSVDRAADFMAYVVSNENAAELAKTGYVSPTNTEVITSDAFLQPNERPVNARVFATTIKGAQALPNSEHWSAVETAVAPLLAALFDDPVIDPLEARLKAIDDTSVPIFNPGAATPAPSASPSS